MNKICLCIKIHVPAIRLNYRFYNINRNHNYIKDSETSKHVIKTCKENIWPLLKTLKNLYTFSGGTFKVAVSIPGSTLSMFQRFAPQTLKHLNELLQLDCIEFLSEPWSHSLIPYVEQKQLLKQMVLHDSMISSIFRRTPDVFLVQSPLYSEKLATQIAGSGKKGMFCYSNSILTDEIQKKKRYKNSLAKFGIFNINYMLSRTLRQADFCSSQKTVEDISTVISKKIRWSIPGENPAVIFYNPTLPNQPFRLKRGITWKTTIIKLLSFPELKFIFPSECVNKFDSTSETQSLQGIKVKRYFHPNFWLENSLQKEAFKKMRKIDLLIRINVNNKLWNDWSLLQDMGYLFYMNTHFSEKRYSENYNNPFESPYIAFINYMNVLDDIWARLHIKMRTARKSTEHV